MKNILSILLVIAVMGVGAMAQAQQPKKVHRIGYLSSCPIQLVSPPVPRQFGWLCASLAT